MSDLEAFNLIVALLIAALIVAFIRRKNLHIYQVETFHGPAIGQVDYATVATEDGRLIKVQLRIKAKRAKNYNRGLYERRVWEIVKKMEPSMVAITLDGITFSY